MEQILEYIERIDDPDNRLIFGDFINWLTTDFPELKPEYDLLRAIIAHTLEDKQTVTSFWDKRKVGE